MITEERLQELERDPRDALPFKAELRELAAAYRTHTAGLQATRAGDGTAWLHFEAPSGKKASLSLEVLAAQHGPVVSQAIHEWADAL